ncbi:MAG: LamG domain-containing protein, partial [Saprospiraceae bacterium]|nr:LamG domain-containing protein [Saprospiraceae bacterium]
LNVCAGTDIQVHFEQFDLQTLAPNAIVQQGGSIGGIPTGWGSGVILTGDTGPTDITDGSGTAGGINVYTASAIVVGSYSLDMRIREIGYAANFIDFSDSGSDCLGYNDDPQDPAMSSDCIIDFSFPIEVTNCTCDFSVTCPTDLNLGSYDCTNLGGIPGFPVVVTNLITGDITVDDFMVGSYGIDVGDNPCGNIVVSTFDDITTPNVCAAGGQTITRTVYIIDDVDMDGVIGADGLPFVPGGTADPTDPFETCVFTITITEVTALSVTCSPPVSLPACTSEGDIATAYGDWLAGFSNADGCNPMVTSTPPTYSYACGEAINLSYTYSVADDCSGAGDGGSFGYTEFPPDSYTWSTGGGASARNIWFVKINLPEDNIITHLGAILGVAGNGIGLIFEDNANQLGSLLGQTSTFGFTANSDNEIPLLSPLSLSSGDYWVGFDFDAPFVTIARDSDASNSQLAGSSGAIFGPPAFPMTSYSSLTIGTPFSTRQLGFYLTSSGPAMCTSTFNVAAATLNITCPPPVTIECDESIDPAINAMLGIATGTVNCGGIPTISYSDNMASGSCGQESVITRTWTARDDCGNMATCDQMITLEDTTPPDIPVEAMNMTVECDGLGNTDELNIWLNSNGGALATENCMNSQNNSLEFDGSDDYVAVANPTNMTLTTTITMEVWVNQSSSSGLQIVLNKEGEYEIAVANGEFLFSIGNDWIFKNTGFILPNNSWTHLAVVYDGSNYIAYVNGSQVYTEASTGPILDAVPTENEFWIGWRQSQLNTTFSGLIDEVRIWSVAQPQTEILNNKDTELEGSESGLIAYFKFDDANSSCDVEDCNSNENHGIRNGSGGNNNLPQFSSDVPSIADVACGGAVASDNCSSISWMNDFTSLSDLCASTGSSTVTFTATDACNNSSTTSATFTIQDMTPPEIIVEAMNLTIECGDPAGISALSVWLSTGGGAVANDNCGSISWSDDYSNINLSDGCGNTGSTLVTFTATDACNLTNTTSATLTITDTTPPTVNCPDDVVDVPCNTSLPLGASNISEFLDLPGVIATDACLAGSLTLIGYTDDVENPGVAFSFCPDEGPFIVIRTYTIADECGIETTCEQTFTYMEDTSPPMVTCTPTFDLGLNPPLGSIDFIALAESLITNIEEDCTTATPSTVAGEVIGTCDASQDFTITITNECGQSDACVVTILWQLAPVITTQLEDVTICNESGDPVFTVTANAGYGGTLTYQWEISTNSGNTWSPIVSAPGDMSSLTVQGD